MERIRDGYYSDAYFNQTKALLEHEGRDPRVVVQVFQRKDRCSAGSTRRSPPARLRGAAAPDGSWLDGWDELEVHALHEGDAIAPWETVMTIEGPYARFAHLETVYLGCLARRTLVMRNVRAVVEAAAGKPILFFPARHDHWLVQTGDGWAAHVAGAIGVSTDAQASWWGGRASVPCPTADRGLRRRHRRGRAGVRRPLRRVMNVTVLVDSRTTRCTTALAVARGSGRALWGVRLDTSDPLADEGLAAPGRGRAAGVAPELVRLVREELDAAGFPGVHIVVSGGFDEARIRAFEAAGVPVDAYGVGSSLLRGANDFTADVVVVDGRPWRRWGGSCNPNPRLERVT